jgi:uncharacterized protein YjbJ (UPF0337 family)/uncharacterized membrane protein (UPF0127 family)
MTPRRLRGLPTAVVLGLEVPVARSLPARLLGLALLPRRRAGPGLLIPRCAAVHSFGMRFALDVIFLDEGGRALRRVEGLRACRFASCRGAVAVLEVPGEPRAVMRCGARVAWLGTERRNDMGFMDKLTGRAKKAAGDLADDGSLKRQGAKEEKKGEAKDQLDNAQDRVEDKADEVADLERKT